jgi:hypothetical protein
MVNFSVFNPELVDIVVLPHSKGGVQSLDKFNENKQYCERLIEKNIIVNDNVVIMDTVLSGTGILALESALMHCFPSIKEVYKISLASSKGFSRIRVDEEIVLPCHPKFIDEKFPRIVQHYLPAYFNNSSKFITKFIDLETNYVAQMIIDIAKDYPEIQVEDTEWYKLNHEITPEIKRLKDIESINQEKIDREIRKQEKEIREREQTIKEGLSFEPIILTNPKRYKCPICGNITGTAAVLHPTDTSYFPHSYNCPNRYKIVKENPEAINQELEMEIVKKSSSKKSSDKKSSSKKSSDKKSSSKKSSSKKRHRDDSEPKYNNYISSPYNKYQKYNNPDIDSMSEETMREMEELDKQADNMTWSNVNRYI